MLINLQTHLYNMIIYMLLNVLSLIRIDTPIYSDLFKFFHSPFLPSLAVSRVTLARSPFAASAAAAAARD
jgi:hypothetical protein